MISLVVHTNWAESRVLKALHWGLSRKILMWSEIVVLLDGFLEFAADFGDGVCCEAGSLVELFPECSVGSLDASVVL